ncbi:MAG: WYL domain-containing protein [Burkholderiales bacterium]|nr:WYL domain-containing protein [Burkholderiales bacterium]
MKELEIQRSDPSWSVLQRLRFIDFRLTWDGRINRGDLIEVFGVSVPQASLDLREYIARAPANVEYDKSRKFYFATPAFKPVFINPTAENYFAQLTMSEHDESPSGLHGVLNFTPPFDVLPSPERRMDFSTLRTIVQAIKAKTAIEIRYQSISTDLPGWRWIEPHALASDGMRWHVRAYCQHRSAFRDFVLGRILDIRGSRPAEVSPERDEEWNEHFRVVIAANPGLAAGQHEIIERDYAMENGKAEIVVRRALLFYLKRRLGVEDGVDKSPNAQQVIIVEIVPM